MLPEAHAPRLAYLFAVAVGLLGFVFGGLLSTFAGRPGAGYVGLPILLMSLSFAVGQFVIGVACGLLWPRAGWRWGVWLYGVPTCIISFSGQGVWFFLGWGLMTMLPACAGAYTAAALCTQGSSRRRGIDKRDNAVREDGGARLMTFS